MVCKKSGKIYMQDLFYSEQLPSPLRQIKPLAKSQWLGTTHKWAGLFLTDAEQIVPSRSL
jgi:hypothetical protein